MKNEHKDSEKWAAAKVCPNCHNSGKWWDSVFEQYHPCPCGRSPKGDE